MTNKDLLFYAQMGINFRIKRQKELIADHKEGNERFLEECNIILKILIDDLQEIEGRIFEEKSKSK